VTDFVAVTRQSEHLQRGTAFGYGSSPPRAKSTAAEA
jgi:hypothetical protein